MLFSPKSNLKSVYSIFRFVPGFASSSSTCKLPDFFAESRVQVTPTTWSFSVSTKNFAQRNERLLPLASCSLEFSFCCYFFTSSKFFAAPANLSYTTATDPDNVVYRMLKHITCSMVDLYSIFNLS